MVKDRVLTAMLIGAMDARQLRKALHMDASTVSHSLSRLLTFGYVRVDGVRRENRRPAIRYALTHRGTEAAHRSIAA